MKKIFGILVLVFFALVIWAFWIEPSRTVYREENLQIASLPKELSGLKIAFLSDLHIGSPHVTLDRLRTIIKTTNAYKPDIILLGGDYMIQGVLGGTPTPPAKIFAELNNLKARLGVFAVMGNHDWWHGYEKIFAEFAQYAPQLTLLEDQAVTLKYNEKEFMLLGISDFDEGPHQYGKAIADRGDKYVIALTHTPDIFPELTKDISLTFAGHTHGGQVYLPLIGRPIVPSRYGERYAIGLIEENGKSLFVSAGIGTSILPVRFLTPPEVNILTIIK